MCRSCLTMADSSFPFGLSPFFGDQKTITNNIKQRIFFQFWLVTTPDIPRPLTLTHAESMCFSPSTQQRPCKTSSAGRRALQARTFHQAEGETMGARSARAGRSDWQRCRIRRSVSCADLPVPPNLSKPDCFVHGFFPNSSEDGPAP